jgi:hypothetical protein
MSFNTSRLNPKSRSLLASLEVLRSEALSYQIEEGKLKVPRDPVPIANFLPYWPVLVRHPFPSYFKFFLI